MTEDLKQQLRLKLCKFISDYYFRFDDNRVEFYIDELKYNYFIYEINDFTTAPDPNVLSNEGSLKINDDMTVTQNVSDYLRHYKSEITYDTWNDFIDYMEENCDWTEMLYIDWDSYRI